MSNELMEFNPEQLAIIKNMFCSNATDMEFKLFIEMARSLGLDPKKREIYFVKYGHGEKAKFSIIVGIDGYRKIAERSGRYMPGKEPSFSYKNNNLFSATSYVKKLGPDKQWHEIGATAILSEYDAKQGQWPKMPHAMLAKCAESLALRRAFPSEMAGTYTEDEMAQSGLIETPPVSNLLPTPTNLAIEPEEPGMSMAQDIALMDLIGDDIDYRNRIFTGYSKILKRDVKTFFDIPETEFEKIKKKIMQHNEERVKSEMERADVS